VVTGTYGECQPDEAIVRDREIREIRRLLIRDSECVIGESKAVDDHGIGDNPARDIARAIGDVPWLLRIHQGARQVYAEDGMV
jgi:hypothetical protein